MKPPETSNTILPLVIAGGGPAGLACGITLCRLGFQPVLINRPKYNPLTRIGESISPASLPVFEKLGITALLASAGHLSSPGQCSAWGHETLAFKDFLFHPNGNGWHLDRARFECDLREHAETTGCHLLEDSIVRLQHQPDGGWRIDTDLNSNAIHAGFLIDATGRSSLVARAAGVGKQKHDRLVAWYAFLEPLKEPCRNATALIEARPGGWFYLALLPDGRMVVSLMTDPELLPGEADRTPDRWLDELGQAPETAKRVKEAGYRLAGPARIAPAGSELLEVLNGHDWVACGDAAACYDPLSSHGIATALATGMDTAHAVADFLQGRNETMSAYSDRVKRSFDYYLKLRRDYYRMENRWPDTPFWKNRHQV